MSCLSNPASGKVSLSGDGRQGPVMDYEICICVACQQRLEFPREMGGQTIDCPTCAQPLILPQLTPPAITEKRKGLFSGFVDMLGEIKERRDESERQRESLAAFQAKLDLVLADGELEAHEVEQLIEALEFFSRSGFQLSEADASAALLKVLRGIQWRDDTDALIVKLHAAIGLPIVNAEMQALIAQGRERLRIERGEFEPIHVPGFISKRGELAYWAEPVALMEDRVVRRRYEGGSRGVSVRVMKGVSFRVGASRGQYVSDTEAVCVSMGSLILTNQRFYLAGDRKNFSIPLLELAQVEFGYDDLTLFEERRETPRILRFSSPDRCTLFRSVIAGLSRNLANVESSHQIGI